MNVGFISPSQMRRQFLLTNLTQISLLVIMKIDQLINSFRKISIVCSKCCQVIRALHERNPTFGWELRIMLSIRVNALKHIEIGLGKYSQIVQW